MVWVLLAVGVLFLGGAGYLFLPTIKTMLGPDFEPAPRDDASVENATMPRMVDGGGA